MNDRATDQDLVVRAQSGDRAALGALIARHQGVAFRVALGITGDEAQAADATQEGFMKALGGLDRFRGDAAFKTWLLAIVANEARGSLRRAKRRREEAMPESAPFADPGRAPDQDVFDDEGAQAVRGLLAHLPEKQRLAVSLRVYDGLSFKEVGELIGSSEGAARVNYHHGIRRLRELMDHERYSTRPA